MSHMLGLSKPLCYQMVHSEAFPAIRMAGGKRIIIPVEALKRYLNEQAGR
ncbi:MAG: helix-turn-helix domain-containing protein [Oscillospiraceae bacterium]|nr:helix-turn-helix domain-containing protein [Oscillospiraceae bacterium]